MFLFSAVEISFVIFGLLGLLMAIRFLLCYHYQVCNLVGSLFCYIGGFAKNDNLLNFFEIFIAKI